MLTQQAPYPLRNLSISVALIFETIFPFHSIHWVLILTSGDRTKKITDMSALVRSGGLKMQRQDVNKHINTPYLIAPGAPKGSKAEQGDGVGEGCYFISGNWSGYSSGCHWSRPMKTAVWVMQSCWEWVITKNGRKQVETSESAVWLVSYMHRLQWQFRGMSFPGQG